MAVPEGEKEGNPVRGKRVKEGGRERTVSSCMQDMAPQGCAHTQQALKRVCSKFQQFVHCPGATHGGRERHLPNHSIQQIGGFTLAAITGEKGENKGLRRREKGPWSLSSSSAIAFMCTRYALRRAAPRLRTHPPIAQQKREKGTHACISPLYTIPPPFLPPPSPFFATFPLLSSVQIIARGDGEGTPHLHHQPAATVAGAEEEKG